MLSARGVWITTKRWEFVGGKQWKSLRKLAPSPRLNLSRSSRARARKYNFAYGGWARSTIGSQNFGVLTKRYDNSHFSSQPTKIKTVHKFLWPPLVVNLSIRGLIWRGTAYFVQNNTTIILPGDTRLTTSELPCRAPVTFFWRQNWSLETQNASYFSLFAN